MASFEFDTSKQPVFFRCDGGYDGYSVHMNISKFYGFAETPNGWWVCDSQGDYLQRLIFGKTEKEYMKTIKTHHKDGVFWINNDGSTKRAWKTVELAVHSYKRRKQVQASIVKDQFDRASTQYAAASVLSAEELDKLKLTGHVSLRNKVAWEPYMPPKQLTALNFGVGPSPF